MPSTFPGDRHTRLIVLSKARTDRAGRIVWLCLCDCGTAKEARGADLRSGHVKSCGCLSRELSSKRLTTHGQTVGRFIPPEFPTWWNMISRCENTTCREYRWYGARGIKVCPEWRASFATFVRDMGHRPSLKHSLDRINNDGNYEPHNCRWATKTEQANNQRSNRLITFRGETKPLAEWARYLSVSYKALHRRLQTGWPIEQAFTAPRYQHR